MKNIFSEVVLRQGSIVVPNDWFPLVPGTTNVLEGQNENGAIETVVTTVSHETDEGTETIIVEVLDQTREVMGISTRVVRDRVFLDGVSIPQCRRQALVVIIK